VAYIKSKFPGVRYREHPTRKHGVRPDRYFFVRYKLDGKDKEESLGWASEGMTEVKASARLAELKEAQRTGKGAVTLAEQRAEAEAERKANQAAEAKEKRESLTFSAFFDEHYAPHAKQDKKSCSWRREDALFRNWIAKAFGSKPIKNIGAVDLERLKRQMVEGGMKPRTIEYALAVVRQIFNHARRTGFFEGESPTRLVKKPKVNNARLRYLGHAEADALLQAVGEISRDVQDMALMSLHCGLRFGEAAALIWGNIDFPKGTLTLLDTKHGDRLVPMTSKVRAMLEERPRCDALVFPARGGGLRGRISKTFMQAVNALGLNAGRDDPRERVCFHSLRHTYASWHVLAGTDLYILGRLMGHKTPSMTARYGHLSPEGAAKATKAFEAILTTKSKPGKVVSINKEGTR